MIGMLETPYAELRSKYKCGHIIVLPYSRFITRYLVSSEDSYAYV